MNTLYRFYKTGIHLGFISREEYSYDKDNES
jgi:hypothetical protein